MRLTIALVSLVSCLSFQNALGGYTEIDLSGSLRRTTLTASDYTANQALTTSLSYYFWQNSAIEVSYTQGLSVKQASASASLPAYRLESDYTLIGLDIVFAWGTRESSFRPYVKAGAMQKKVTETLKPEGYDVSSVEMSPKLVPSSGLGLQLMMSQTFAIKLGVDAWPSDSLSNGSIIWDYATRVGLSWFIL